MAHGRVWAGTWDGRIISWDALTGDIRWVVKAGAPCHWQPVVHDGWIHAGLEDGTLLSFATGDPLEADWPMWGGGCGHNGKPIPEARPSSGPPTTLSPDWEEAGYRTDREPAAAHRRRRQIGRAHV